MWSVMKVNCGFLDHNIFANLNPTFYRITGSDYDYYDFLFLKNCAPNETVGLYYYNTNMIPGGPNFKKKKRDHFASKHEILLTMTTGLLQDDDEGSKSYFLNGDYITELKKKHVTQLIKWLHILFQDHNFITIKQIMLYIVLLIAIFCNICIKIIRQ